MCEHMRGSMGVVFGYRAECFHGLVAVCGFVDKDASLGDVCLKHMYALLVVLYTVCCRSLA